jgi:choline dehydrogenase-like flavoprotein
MPGRHAPPKVELEVQFSETLAGAAVLGSEVAGVDEILGGGAFSMRIRVRLPRLSTFENGNRVQGKVVEGEVRWEGQLKATPLERNGDIQLIRDGRIAGVSRIRLKVRALDPSGGRILFIINRTLDPLGKPYDSRVQVRRRGKLVGSGVIFDPPRGYDQHISDVEMVGGGPIDRQIGLQRFFTIIRSAPRPHRRDTSEVAKMVQTLVSFLHTQKPGGPTAEDIKEQYLQLLRRVPGWRRTSIVRFLQGNVGALHFFREATRILIRNPLATVANTGSLDAAHNLYQFLYYTLLKSHEEIGHRAMPLEEPRMPVHAENDAVSLDELALERDRDGWALRGKYDVVIVGSGPAGSLLAHRLSTYKRVLVLEKGPAVREGIHRATDNPEFNAYTDLYEGAGLQAANDDWGELNKTHGSIFILQGSCVGGGGMVNNSICVRMSDERIRRWVKAGFPLKDMVGATPGEHSEELLHAAYDVVAKELKLKPMGQAMAPGAPQNPIAGRLTPWDPSVAPTAADHRDGQKRGYSQLLLAKNGCVGCGFCNVGCAYGAKRSAYDVYLREAMNDPQRDLTVVAGAEVVDIKLTSNGGAVDHLVVQDGESGKQVRVRAGEYVLSAGAIGSSTLLLKSPDVRRTRVASLIGSRFTANLAVPLIAVYRDRPQERRGLQMTHSFVPERGEDRDGYVIETWSSEPGGFALGVPGYFNSHHSNMSAYERSAAAVVLVGSHHSLGSVHWYDPKIPRSDRAFDTKLDDYKIRPDKRRGVHLEARPYVVLETRQRDEDGQLTRHAERLRDSLRNGLRRLAKQMIRSGGPDLKHVLVPSRHGWKMRTIADVDRVLGEEADLDTGKAPFWKGHLRDIRALRITSAHPQGGNPMMGRGGVVGPDFRMRGLSNLRICDASVFPDNTGVNPQWTVLALAHLCSEAMLKEEQQEAHR